MATTIGTLTDDENTRLREFPVCRHGIYFAHASSAPLPKRIADGMVAYIQRATTADQEAGDVLERVRQTRAAAARLLDAVPEEIALTGSTSLSLNVIAHGLEWKSGDQIICYGDDYPADVYAWTNLRARGVELVFLKPAAPGEITRDLVEKAITPRTKLVALTSCHYLSGYRIDVDAIGRLCGERGVLFSLDAIQSLGAFPVSVQHVDFLSAGAQKWLLGPSGAGILFVKKSRFEQLRPPFPGGWNTQSPNYIAQSEITWAEGAQRYEPGALNYGGIMGMRVALELAAELGPKKVASRLTSLKEQLVKAIQPLGAEFLGPTSSVNASSITTFSHPKMPSEEIVKVLEKNETTVSLRHDRAGKAYVRMSPHFYNTADEIAEVASILKRALGA